MSPQLLKHALDEKRRMQLVDVRSQSEFSAGHIPAAINIPMEQIESRVADLDASSTLVLVCQSGTRATIAQRMLASRHPDMTVLEGGTKAWIATGLPTVATARSRWSLERQVRFGAGLMVLVGAGLALTVSARWLYLCIFVGAGLTFAGATDICGMGILLSRMPWNRASRISGPATNPARSTN